MIDLGGRRMAARGAMLLLVLAVLLGIVISAGSLPHTHAAFRPGLYNEEHDLTLLAAVGGVGPLPESPSVSPVALLALLVVLPISWGPCPRPRRPIDSRAPPIR